MALVVRPALVELVDVHRPVARRIVLLSLLSVDPSVIRLLHRHRVVRRKHAGRLQRVQGLVVVIDGHLRRDIARVDITWQRFTRNGFGSDGVLQLQMDRKIAIPPIRIVAHVQWVVDFFEITHPDLRRHIRYVLRHKADGIVVVDVVSIFPSQILRAVGAIRSRGDPLDGDRRRGNRLGLRRLDDLTFAGQLHPDLAVAVGIFKGEIEPLHHPVRIGRAIDLGARIVPFLVAPLPRRVFRHFEARHRLDDVAHLGVRDAQLQGFAGRDGQRLIAVRQRLRPRRGFPAGCGRIPSAPDLHIVGLALRQPGCLPRTVRGFVRVNQIPGAVLIDQTQVVFHVLLHLDALQGECGAFVIEADQPECVRIDLEARGKLHIDAAYVDFT